MHVTSSTFMIAEHCQQMREDPLSSTMSISGQTRMASGRRGRI